jgi:hypothetical protein
MKNNVDDQDMKNSQNNQKTEEDARQNTPDQDITLKTIRKLRTTLTVRLQWRSIRLLIVLVPTIFKQHLPAP